MKFEYTVKNVEYVISLIKKNLTPDLLNPKFRTENKTNPMFGHCKHASEAFVLLMNTDKLNLMRNTRGKIGHVWVQDENKIYDITADQFYIMGSNPCYENSSSIKCISSAKTDVLIERVLWTHQELAQVPPEPPDGGSIITR